MNSIRNRLIIAVLLLVLLPSLMVVYGMFAQYRASIENTVKANLGLAADNKAEQVESYVRERKADTSSLAEMHQLVEDLKTLRRLFKDAGFGSAKYRAEEARVRGSYEKYVENYGYHDFFMVDADGTVILSNRHEDDYGTNLFTGPYHDEELAKVVRTAATAFETDFSKYSYYAPSGELAAFVASPVLDGGKLVGILAVQVDSGKYEKVMTDSLGLGASVETVIAEEIKGKILFLSSGQYRPGGPVKLGEYPTTKHSTPSLKALRGERGEGVLIDHRNIEVVAAWRYLPSAHISMVVKLSTAEAFAAVDTVKRYLYAALAVMVLFIIMFGIWIGRAIIWPVNILEAATGAMAKGNLAQRVPVNAEDEIGRLAQSFNAMAERLQSATTGLEKEVRDRTRELANANEKLSNNINEMVTVEAKLRQTTAFQRAILDSANYSIISTAVDGTIKSWNRGAEKMLGYAAGEMVDRQTPAILHAPGEVQRRAKELSAELGVPVEAGFEVFVAKARLGVPDENDWTYIRKDGTTFPVRLSVTALLDEQKRITGFLGVGFDITDQKIAEHLLEKAKENAEIAADEARKANQYKTEFLANMSHEIRTPLNAILGMADLLAETPLDDEQKRYLQVFRGASENLLYLVNDILDLTKIEAGQMDIEETEFDFKETLDSAIGIILPRAQRKGLPLSVNINRLPAEYLVGDSVRLRQVLLNIMSNAVKFSPKGIIKVDINFRETDNGVETVIAVADQGIGIPKEKQLLLFQRFRQADASVTRQYGGTGLGLAISKMLAEKMGGTITLESEPGKGSTFTITALFRKGRPKEAVPKETGLAGMKVVVFFEEEAERQRVAGVLENAGARVRPVASEAELKAELAQAGAERPLVTVVLTDCDVVRGNACRLAFDLGQNAAGIGNNVKMLTVASGGICTNKPKEGALASNCCLVSPVGGKELIRELRKMWAESHKSSALAGNGKGKDAQRILLVEDAKDNQLLIKAYLKKSPYRLEFAENGLEAVEKYKNGIFDLVLMDVQMPVKDGYTATREIRAYEKENNRPRTPIIALTANAYQEDVTNSINSGCDAHMTKPIVRGKLLAAIEEAFKRG